jgi:hypothetical protein
MPIWFEVVFFMDAPNEFKLSLFVGLVAREYAKLLFVKK